MIIDVDIFKIKEIAKKRHVNFRAPFVMNSIHSFAYTHIKSSRICRMWNEGEIFDSFSWEKNKKKRKKNENIYQVIINNKMFIITIHPI